MIITNQALEAMLPSSWPSQVGFLSFQHRADGNGLSFEHANITGNINDMAGLEKREETGVPRIPRVWCVCVCVCDDDRFKGLFVQSTSDFKDYWNQGWEEHHQHDSVGHLNFGVEWSLRLADALAIQYVQHIFIIYICFMVSPLKHAACPSYFFVDWFWTWLLVSIVQDNSIWFLLFQNLNVVFGTSSRYTCYN